MGSKGGPQSHIRKQRVLWHDLSPKSASFYSLTLLILLRAIFVREVCVCMCEEYGWAGGRSHEGHLAQLCWGQVRQTEEWGGRHRGRTSRSRWEFRWMGRRRRSPSRSSGLQVQAEETEISLFSSLSLSLAAEEKEERILSFSSLLFSLSFLPSLLEQLREREREREAGLTLILDQQPITQQKYQNRQMRCHFSNLILHLLWVRALGPV